MPHARGSSSYMAGSDRRSSRERRASTPDRRPRYRPAGRCCHAENENGVICARMAALMAQTRKAPARRRARTVVPRRRRSPELARQEILDASERVFVDFQPDQVGLKEVAREAGVSHALITHYFGTFANMIEAVLERRVGGLRARILEKLRDTQGVLSRPGEL